MASSIPAQSAEPQPSFPRRAWQLTYPYWQSEEKVRAWGLLILIVVLNLFAVYLSVLFNDWYQRFYDALEKKSSVAFWKEMLSFSWLAVLWMIVSVYRVYVQQVLEMRWRNWLNANFLAKWLSDRAYYGMQLMGTTADNPDQRIAEDLKLFTSMTLGLTLGVLSAVVTLISFVGILWAVSGPLNVSFGGLSFTIPGYMVWACVGYAAIGSLITHWVGKPLIGLNFAQQRYEANYRFGLVRVRENAESIALYGGETSERSNLLTHFNDVLTNWWSLVRVQKRLGWFTFGYGQAAVIFPFLLAGSRYLSGAISLGTLMKIQSAFGEVKGALSWFVENYGNIAPWKASVDRLLSFQDSIAQVRAKTQDAQGIQVDASNDGKVAVDDVTLALPDGRAIARNLTLDVAAGERLLLTGDSGTGKSTLFRAIAGIWPFGRGRVSRPDGKRTLFLPQKPYLPIGALRDTVSYPGKPGEFSDAQIVDALRACKLEGFITRLDEQQHWGQLLSPGEQQRLAFARALLHKPDWLFMDEATSALDEATEKEMYRLLNEHLPNSTFVSIAHRPNVAAFHTRRIEIAPDGNGKMTLQGT
jgi:vitamin B12/bleomycin/antimicrobial peptide transport system ATP-binding/permease protein